MSKSYPMKSRKSSTSPSDSEGRTKWELFAKQDLTENALAIWYERAGKYQYSAGMPQEEADKRAFLEVVKNER
jgi:hypothetical protein